MLLTLLGELTGKDIKMNVVDGRPELDRFRCRFASEPLFTDTFWQVQSK